MAYTQALQMSFSIQDGLGTKASQVVYALADPTKTLANLVTDAQAMATLIAGIIDGKILSVNAALVIVPSVDQTGKPVSTSRVEQTGVFDFPYGSPVVRQFGEAVPSLSDDVIADDTIVLTTPVSDFTDAMSSASTNAVYQPTSNTFVDLGALTDAFISFRKRRKSLTRSSFELP